MRRPTMPVPRIAATAVASLVLIGLTGCSTAAAPDPTPSASSSCTPAAAHTSPVVAFSDLPGAASFTQTAAEASGRTIRMAAVTTAFSNFTAAAGTIDGGVLGPAAVGLVGAGAKKTVFEVAPNTSTHAADVPTTFPSTNQLSVLRVTGATAVLKGFAVQGTDQGHLYNGLRIDRLRDLVADDITVSAIPGGAASPPGETFGINDYRTTGSHWSHVVVDGAGVGASGFGVNDSTDIQICDTVSRDNPHGMGFAFWQSSGIRLVDCRAIDNGRAGFNFERVSGSNELIHPDASGNTYGMRISSDISSAKFTIVDPVMTDGHFTVTLPNRYNGSVNQQRRSDITLIVHGKSRPDLLRFQTY